MTQFKVYSNTARWRMKTRNQKIYVEVTYTPEEKPSNPPELQLHFLNLRFQNASSVFSS